MVTEREIIGPVIEAVAHAEQLLREAWVEHSNDIERHRRWEAYIQEVVWGFVEMMRLWLYKMDEAKATTDPKHALAELASLFKEAEAEAALRGEVE